MLRVFSDRTRLRILRSLQSGELCVGELVAILRILQPSVSRHLRYLRRSGLVVTRKHGPWKLYALRPARAAFHAGLLKCLGTSFREVPDLRADVVRAQRVKASRRHCPR